MRPMRWGGAPDRLKYYTVIAERLELLRNMLTDPVTPSFVSLAAFCIYHATRPARYASVGCTQWEAVPLVTAMALRYNKRFWFCGHGTRREPALVVEQTLHEPSADACVLFTGDDPGEMVYLFGRDDT